MRAFRFSTRLSFKIEDKTYEAIKFSDEIKNSFSKKISKERIGKEMLNTYSSSKYPFKFIEYL